MAKQEYYIVTEPPSSQGVAVMAKESFEVSETINLNDRIMDLRAANQSGRGLVALTVRLRQDIPRPPDESIILRIQHQTFNELGRLATIEGVRITSDDNQPLQESNDQVVVYLADDPTKPASASITTA